jgi:hypothetical protein
VNDNRQRDHSGITGVIRDWSRTLLEDTFYIDFPYPDCLYCFLRILVTTHERFVCSDGACYETSVFETTPTS